MQNVRLQISCPIFKSNQPLGAVKKSVRKGYQNLGGTRENGKQTCFDILAVKLPYDKSDFWQSGKKKTKFS
jgi:hypothetical protein